MDRSIRWGTICESEGCDIVRTGGDSLLGLLHAKPGRARPIHRDAAQVRRLVAIVRHRHKRMLRFQHPSQVECGMCGSRETARRVRSARLGRPARLHCVGADQYREGRSLKLKRIDSHAVPQSADVGEKHDHRVHVVVRVRVEAQSQTFPVKLRISPDVPESLALLRGVLAGDRCRCHDPRHKSESHTRTIRSVGRTLRCECKRS